MEQFEPKLKLISASAGTGKTYTMIQEITKALEHTEPEKIVAITFTRAATRDIRNKVKELGELNVNTIHGFFAGLLREQSIYFKQSANFKILEEFDEAKLFRDSAASVMLKRIGSEPDEAFFAEYEFSNIIDMLLKLEKHYAVIKDKIITDLKELIEEEKRAEYQRMVELMPHDLEEEIIKPLNSRHANDDTDDLEILRKEICRIAKKLKPLSGQKDFHHNIEVLKELPDYDNKNKGKAKNWDSNEEKKIVLDAAKALNDLRRGVKEDRLGEIWVVEEAARYRKQFFDLFLEAHAHYEKRKAELDLLSYNDIEVLTHKLVKENKKVADYYRDKFDYIFVDEFQDTNKMQSDVLFQIGKNIFVVGDAKQSIYRFRNADVRVFMETQAKCSKEELEELKTNWRCLPKIVEAVNTAFPQIFGHSHSEHGRQDFEAEYLSFEPKRNDGEGLVRFINAPSPSKHYKAFNHELEAKIALDIINKGLSEGKNYDDFALLFRSSNHMLEFEKLFRDKGLPFVVFGGESRKDLLSSLRCLFNIILNPNDDTSMFEVLKLPAFYTSEKDLYKIRKEELSIWEVLDDKHPVKELVNRMRAKKDHGSFTEFVAEVLRVSRFIPSASLIFTGQDSGAEEAILRAAMHVESEGEGIEYFLDFLFSMKNQDAGTKSNAVKLMTVHASKGLEFNTVIIPCLDNDPNPAKDSIVLSDDGSMAVKLGDEDSNKKLNTVLYQRIKDYEEEADLAESKRLLYVAMTRAKDSLYLISDLNKSKSGLNGKRWVDWISKVFSDRIEEYSLQEERSLDAPRIKVVRAKDTNLPSSLEEAKKIPTRFSVSYLRDQFIKYDNKKSVGELGLGTIIHSILEHWDDREQVEAIYKRIGPDAAMNISKVVDDFTASELGKKIFSAPKTLCEYPFAVLEEGDIISGRIDRINIYDDHVWVLDYKTFVNEEDLKGYKTQIDCYVKFARKAFPGKEVRASIVDVSGCKEYKE